MSMVSRILIFCKDSSADQAGFPERKCPDGLRLQVGYPSCWWVLSCLFSHVLYIRFVTSDAIPRRKSWRECGEETS